MPAPVPAAPEETEAADDQLAPPAAEAAAEPGETAEDIANHPRRKGWWNRLL
jgi:hypothetical protein